MCYEGAADIECYGLSRSERLSAVHVAQHQLHDRLVITTGSTWPGSLAAVDQCGQDGYLPDYGISGSATHIKALIASSPEAVDRCHVVHNQVYGPGAAMATNDPTLLVPAQWAHLQPFDVTTTQMATHMLVAGIHNRLRWPGLRLVGTSTGTQTAIAGPSPWSSAGLVGFRTTCLPQFWYR